MEGIHQTYIVYGRDSSNLYCLWKELIKLILFMEGTHQTYMLCVSGCRKGWMGPYCQQRKFIGFIIYNTDHTVNSINSMCPYCKQLGSNLYCLWKELIKLILFMEGTHQTYIVYGRMSSFHKQYKFDESLP
jgi:hypothetical protein